MRPPMNWTDTTIILPCRNEAATIQRALREVAAAVPGAELLVIHGGSDRTLERAGELRGALPRLVLVPNPGDRGKGHAVREAIRRAAGRCIAQFDTDLQFHADDLPALLAPVRSGAADVCVGSRFLPQSDAAAESAAFARDWGNRLLSAYASLLAGRRFSDVTTGMKAWARSAMDRIAYRDDQYSYEVELLVRAARLGLRVTEVPVRYRERSSGASMHRNNLAVAKAGLVILCKTTACRFRRRPAGPGAPPHLEH